MDLRILKYFLLVAKEENITKASKELHITQPSLSRHIQALEDELGIKLFTRSKYKVTLTSEGTLFYRRAQEIISLSEKAIKEVKNTQEELTGQISIGCGEFLSMDELSKKISTFLELNPKVIFNILSSNNVDIKTKIEEGILDLGLLVEPINASKYNYTRLKEKEICGILVRNNDPLASNEVITPKDLVGRKIMMNPDEMVHNELFSWFGNYANDISIAISYNLIYNAASLCRATRMPIVCIKLKCNYDGLKFIPFSDELFASTILVWKEHQIKSKAVSEFIHFIKNAKNV